MECVHRNNQTYSFGHDYVHFGWLFFRFSQSCLIWEEVSLQGESAFTYVWLSLFNQLGLPSLKQETVQVFKYIVSSFKLIIFNSLQIREVCYWENKNPGEAPVGRDKVFPPKKAGESFRGQVPYIPFAGGGDHRHAVDWDTVPWIWKSIYLRFFSLEVHVCIGKMGESCGDFCTVDFFADQVL